MARVLVLGITGMLGGAVFRVFSADSTHQTWGTLRNVAALHSFPQELRKGILAGGDVLDQDTVLSVLCRVKPDVVINCVGLVKQLADANDPLTALPVNAMLPHRLARLCELIGARLIHVSTDCVFSGRKGNYVETDTSDAEDLYGKSKYIGELHSSANAITLRTSIIGHEYGSKHALVDWFLSQQGSVKGFTKAIFSGLPTVELARVMKDFVVPRSDLSGLYHVAAEPIAKFDLLKLIAAEYDKLIDILPDASVVIDRTLSCSRFEKETGYIAPVWPELVRKMKAGC